MNKYGIDEKFLTAEIRKMYLWSVESKYNQCNVNILYYSFLIT